MAQRLSQVTNLNRLCAFAQLRHLPSLQPGSDRHLFAERAIS
jgi:hypothetical protein